jgi:hypothetical protein
VKGWLNDAPLALPRNQWDRLAIFCAREGHVGVTAKGNRLFVEAAPYRYRAGIPWRDLPETEARCRQDFDTDER